MAQNPTSSQELDQDYQRLLVEVWKRNEGTIFQWVGSLQAAASCLTNGELDQLGAEQAGRAAHKLHGCLGSFGLGDASRIAQEIEKILTSREWVQPDSRKRIADLTDSLERDILLHRL